jgi:hypothetical protein
MMGTFLLNPCRMQVLKHTILQGSQTCINEKIKERKQEKKKGKKGKRKKEKQG